MAEKTQELSEILRRLAKVEQQNRQLKRIGLGALVLACAMFLMGQAHPSRIIEAEKFILKDSNGKVRATLGMEFKDRPTFTFIDAKGLPQVALAAGENPFLSLCKGTCESQVQIGTYSDAFGLSIYGKDTGGPLHGVQVALGVVKGLPGLNLFGSNTTEQASLDFEAGGPRLVLFHPDGAIALQKASFELSDKQGFRTTIGTTELETPLTGETRKTSAASIVLFEKDGKAIWSAP